MGPATVRSRLPAWAPGLAALRGYRLADLPHDVTGGIAVAAVTVPVSIANAQLAGLPAQHGLYGSILPRLTASGNSLSSAKSSKT